MGSWDVAIIGSGIAGLSLAWHLNNAGKRVVVLEKNAKAEGASVRNLGMVWAVGQADEGLEQLAFRSHELWKQASSELGFWHRQCGSLHLAYEPLELAVLEEFVALTGARHERSMLSPAETHALCPNIRTDGLLGALFSPTEGAVDPREAVHVAAQSLEARGVDVRFNANAVQVQTGCVVLADGTHIEAEKIAVCAGPQLYDLFPKDVEDAGLEECRLQMLRLRPRSGTSPLGIHLCAGLTLGHYRNFRICPSLPDLMERHEAIWPVQVENGIHILVSEHADGRITVGDSHAYGREGPAYLEEDVYLAILEALDAFLPADLYEVDQRWMGTYPTHTSLPYWLQEVEEDVWALSLFGTGMTLSFGITEQLAIHLTEQP